MNGILGEKPTAAAMLVALGLGLSCAWWNLLHEIAFYYMVTYEAQADNCFLGFVGGCIAGCLVLVLRAVGRLDRLTMRVRTAIFAADVVLVALYYLCILAGPADYAGAFVCYVLLNLTFYGLVIYLLKDMQALGMHQTVLALAGAAAVYALVELVSQPLYFDNLPDSPLAPEFLVRLGVHIALIAGSAVVLALVARRSGSSAAEEGAEAPNPFRAPAPLVVNVVFYSIIFGAIHNLASGIVSNPVMKLTPNHVGMLAGALLFFFTFGSQAGSGRIWVKMRSVAFPVTMVGFLLLPLSEDKTAVLSVFGGDCATINYYLIFLLSCVAISKRANLDILKVSALGIALAAAGFLAGDAGSSFLRTHNLMGTTTYVCLTLAAFIMLIAATFWTGDDRKASLLWGLEEKRAPRRFDVNLLNARCDAVANLYNLSAREDEVLRLLAQEKKPDQIKDELFISLATVRSHIHRIYVKLDVHSNVQLMELVEGVPLPAEDEER